MNLAVVGIVAVCGAITAALWRISRQRDRQLRDRDAQLNALFNAVRIGTWSHDLITNRAVSHGRINEIYGFPPDQPEYRFDDIVRAVHPEDRDYFVTTARNAMQGSTPTFEMEHRVLWPDGSIHWILAEGGVSRYAAGKPACLSGMNLDITSRKQAELALRESEASVRRLNSSLEERVQIRTHELEVERSRAEEANRAKSDFLAAMSHEIRTPMNAILGMADLLWETELNADQRQYVEIFRQAGSNLMDLINDILDLSKIEAGRLELEKVEFDLEHLLDQVMELLGSKARDKGVVLLARLAPGVTRNLLGDPTRLRQVLVNLLGNAIKFTPSGEVIVTAANVAGGQPGEICFSVSDTGIGIPPEKLATIFDSFTQVDTSTTRQYGGTGLGLAICRRLVHHMNTPDANGEHLNSTITVESEVGRGSTFRFTLSLEPAPENTLQLSPGIQDLQGLRVLVIDDSATNRLILRETLASWGLKSREFAAAEVALLELEQAHREDRDYALVIADHHLQGMGGFEAAPRIQAASPGTPILMLTSDAQLGDASRRLAAGIVGFAVKPVKRSDLLRLICQALRLPEAPRAAPHQPHPRQPAAAAEAKRILIAEDSADNRFLVETYLRGSPHSLTFVADGRAAVERFADAEFDLVLMDIQMPVMDGLTATQTIRHLEKERGRNPVPIIALTANAHPQDVERSLRAGCDSHLSKPVSKATLLHAIQNQDQPVPIMIQVPQGLEALVPRYLEARRKELPEMLALLAAADFERISSLAHNLKGTGSAYGLPDITEIGAELERSATCHDPHSIDTQLTRLEKYLNQVYLPINRPRS